MNDTVEVEGLSVILDDEVDPPYLELRLRCNGQEHTATILAAEDEWALNLRGGEIQSEPDDVQLYPAQSDAIVAAMLIALETSRASSHSPPGL